MKSFPKRNSFGHVQTSVWVNQAKIIIFSDGAKTLKDAIETYGHELGHFNHDWDGSHHLVEKYGISVYEIYIQNK